MRQEIFSEFCDFVAEFRSVDHFGIFRVFRYKAKAEALAQADMILRSLRSVKVTLRESGALALLVEDD